MDQAGVKASEDLLLERLPNRQASLKSTRQTLNGCATCTHDFVKKFPAIKAVHIMIIFEPMYTLDPRRTNHPNKSAHKLLVLIKNSNKYFTTLKILIL